MKDYKDIRDDQIRVIGDEDVVSKTPLKRYIYIFPTTFPHKIISNYSTFL